MLLSCSVAGVSSKCSAGRDDRGKEHWAEKESPQRPPLTSVDASGETGAGGNLSGSWESPRFLPQA